MRTLVTGATRGIGLERVKRLSARGDDVLATARDGEAPTADRWDRLDVTDEASVRALSARHPDPLDLLVCNAGVYLDKLHQLEDGFPPEMWAETFAIDHAVQQHFPVSLCFKLNVEAFILKESFLVGYSQWCHICQLDKAKLKILFLWVANLSQAHSRVAQCHSSGYNCNSF